MGTATPGLLGAGNIDEPPFSHLVGPLPLVGIQRDTKRKPTIKCRAAHIIYIYIHMKHPYV